MTDWLSFCLWSFARFHQMSSVGSGPGSCVGVGELILVSFLLFFGPCASSGSRESDFRRIIFYQSEAGAKKSSEGRQKVKWRLAVALFFWPFYQISRCRGRVEMNGIHHSNQHDKLYNLNTTCIFSELSLWRDSSLKIQVGFRLWSCRADLNGMCDSSQLGP